MQKLTPDQPETQSLDGVMQNLTRLQDLFPEAFTEGKLDFDVLKELLGSQIDDRPEKYGLNWNGKARARRHALTPTRATLRPDKQSSVDWDTTQNLMIEGDNLEVLKLLQRSYAGKVKLIYIDPPYNTGKDFVYPDDYTDSLKNYQGLTGQLEEGRHVSSNIESSGRFHTDWLNMMYPRLKLARELLREDGVIFVSIDDSEIANIRRLMDEVFGEENFVGTFVWKRRASSALAERNVSTDHEYVVSYQRQNFVSFGSEKDYTQYRNPDNDPRGDWVAGDLTVGMGKDLRPNQFYTLEDPKTGKRYAPNPNRVWAYIPESMNNLIDEDRVIFPEDTSKRPMLKRFRNELKSNSNPVSTWLQNSPMNTEATREIQSLMPEGGFDYPKSVRFIGQILDHTTTSNDIILDFFSGSGTTGHAVMAQNAADNGNRQFILVQLPEPLNPAKAEQKTSADFTDSLGVPRNIAELTKERLRRAGAKVKAENPMFAGDTGFRVFKLDSSNVLGWDSNTARADLAGALQFAEVNIKAERTETDVLYEVLLKLGLPLTTPIDQCTIAGLHVEMLGGGALVACLARSISSEQVQELGKGIADWLEAENPAGEAHILFLDNSFGSDTAKLNLTKYLEQRAKNLNRNWRIRSI